MNCFAAEIAIKIGKKLNAADENISNNINHQVSVKCPKPTLSTTPKIPGTELDVNYENVISVVKGEEIKKTLQPGTIVEMKDRDGKVISYYIVKNPTWIDNMNGSIYGLLELTNEKAVVIDGIGKEAIEKTLGTNIKEGQKIYYDGKYYINRQNTGDTQVPVTPGSYYWLEIK